MIQLTAVLSNTSKQTLMCQIDEAPLYCFIYYCALWQQKEIELMPEIKHK